jgi:hypothetical protein
VEVARDLGCVDLWQRSLERSLARRGKAARCSMELQRLGGRRDLGLAEPLRDSGTYSALRRQSRTRTGLPLVGAGGASVVALVAAFGSLLAGRSGANGGSRIAFKRSSAVASASLVPGAAVASQPGGAPPSATQPARAATAAARPTQPARAGGAGTPQASASSGHAVATRPVASQAEKVSRMRSGALRSQTHAVQAHTHTMVMARMARASGPPGSGGAAVGSPVRTVTTTGTSSHPHVTRRHHRARVRHTRHSGGAAPRQGVTTGSYVNPFAHASVTPERIDQGVDYAGSGTLTAIGDGTVTYVGTSGTGWPGAFIEYRLLGGADAGRYVYDAEGVTPVSGLHVGQRVSAGQPLVQLIPGYSTGIEVGWGAGIGTETYAMQTGGWNPQMDQGNAASSAGKSFSALIVSLGGPGGKVEG